MKVIAAWATPSSQGTTTYESVLYDDGSTSCSCPGWVIKRAGKERTCRHVGRDLPADVRAMQAEILQGRQPPQAAPVAMRAGANRSAFRRRPPAAAPSRAATATAATVDQYLRRRRAIGFEE